MDHKSWLWKKRSTEKAIITDDKSSLSSGKDGNETLLDSNSQLERDVKILNEKLSSALSECTHKEDYAKKQAKIAQEAMTGWEKTETEALSLKKELDKALQQQVASEDRLVRLDGALKECMQQLRFVREEQEKRINDAVMKASREFEITKMSLDQKLAEAKRRISSLDGENSQLCKALLAKENLIGELHNHREQIEADFSNLITRVESTEKENSCLKYEVRVLGKELEIRNEEREFTRRTAEVSHRQHLESAKKIAKLESECQRLRGLVRKRFPGPAALAKMSSEVDMMGRSQSDSIPMLRKVNFLTEQLGLLEEENRNLKDGLDKKMSEDKNTSAVSEMSLASMSDIGSDDKASCAESWTSTLISDIEQFRNGKVPNAPSRRTVESSDISLMDDFVEMEKLAIISAKDLSGNNNHKPVEVLDEIKAALVKEDLPKLQSNVANSIHKIVELLEGISIPPQDDSENQTGYVGRMFQWKASELGSTLKQFVQTCNDLLSGKSDLESFAEQLAVTLEWIMNHCFSLQDVSSMKDAYRNYLDWDETRSEGDFDCGAINPVLGSNQMSCQNEGFFSSPIISVSNDVFKDAEKQDELSEDLETQLMEAENELKEADEKLIFVKTEMENKDHGTHCETPVLQKSPSMKEITDETADNKRETQPDWEIVAASEKLAECQETILNLGKQLKAMASPNEAALFDKVISSPAHNGVVSTFTTPERSIRRRTSLLDKMLAEDRTAEVQTINSPKIEVVVSDGNNGSTDFLKSEVSLDDVSEVGSMAMVPGKKKGGLLKRILRRRNKGGC